jgi:protein-disulfide isomerase
MTEPTEPGRASVSAPSEPSTPNTPLESSESPPATVANPDLAAVILDSVPPGDVAAPPDSVAADGPAPGEPVTVAASSGTDAAGEARPSYPWPSEQIPAASGVQDRGLLARFVAVALGGVLVGAIAFGFVGGTFSGPKATPSPSPSPTALPSVAPAGNTVGRPDAPVTIEVWADYQCPYCRLDALLFGGALQREYVMPGIARIVYRDFAFLGQESTDAAVAARCAGAQEAAAQVRYHDALFAFQQGENQGRFARQNLLQIATMAGVPDAKAFAACLDDPAVARAVADETAAGRSAGVSSTPTLRLRGPAGERTLTGFSQTWPPLRDAIEAVLVAPVASPSPGASAAPTRSAVPTPSSVPAATPTSGSSPTPGPGSTATPTPGPTATSSSGSSAAPTP